MTASSFGTKNEPKFADADGPDVAYNPTQVAAYAAKVGNRRTGTSTEMNAATGADVWEGLEWGNTTNGYTFTYVSGGWKPPPTTQITHLFMASEGFNDSVTQYPSLAVDPTNSTNSTQATWVRVSGTAPAGVGAVRITDPGTYIIQATHSLPVPASGRSFMQIGADGDLYSTRSAIPSGEDAMSATLVIRTSAAGALVQLKIFKVNGSVAGAKTRVTVTRLS